MLRETLGRRIEEYILKKSLNNSLGLGESFTVYFLAQGEYNINFTLESNNKKYVFRVNTGSQLEIDNQIKYEYDALKVLEISGVTPKVCYLDDTKEELGYGVLVMEFLEGIPLEYDKDLVSAARIFSRIHSIDTEAGNFENFIVEQNIFEDRIKEGKRLLRDFFNYSGADKKLKNFFYNFLDWCEKNKYREKYFLDNKWMVINNTEVNSHNFIIGKEKAFLIDWEKPVISDPCQDLTQFLAPTTTLWKTDYVLSGEEKEAFIKEYVNGLSIGDKNIKERIELYTPYLYLRALAWCAYALVGYESEYREIKNMDTYKKIKQYLDLDFMEDLLRFYF